MSIAVHGIYERFSADYSFRGVSYQDPIGNQVTHDDAPNKFE